MLQKQLKLTKQAFKQLEIAVLKDHTLDDLYVDAIIKRFEFTYEMIWKLTKTLMNDVFEQKCYSPRKCFKLLIRLNIFTDKKFLWDMINARNLTSHTYNIDYALNVLNFIKQNLNKIKNLINNLELTISSEFEQLIVTKQLFS